MPSRRQFCRAARTLAATLKASLNRSLAIAVACAIGVSPLIAARASADNVRAFGEYLSAECVTCHQVTGRSTGGIPKIVAWPTDQFVAVLKSYKQKQRDNPVMQTIAARLSDEEMTALATYFASLPSK